MSLQPVYGRIFPFRVSSQNSRPMPVKRAASHARHPNRHMLEQFVVPAVRLVRVSQETIPAQVILEIFDALFTGGPTLLEPPQTFVPQGRSSEVQSGASQPGMMLNRFPHDQIVSAQMLQRFVRRAEFVNGLSSQTKIDSSR